MNNNDPWNNTFNASSDPSYYSPDNHTPISPQKQSSFYDNHPNPNPMFMSSVGRKASFLYDSEIESLTTSDAFYGNRSMAMGRHRAETISFTRPFTLDQNVNLLNPIMTADANTSSSRNRSGSLNLPAKGGLNDSFAPSFFGNTWESQPSHAFNTPMSLADPSSYISKNSSLLLQQQKNSLTNAFDSAQPSFQSPQIQGESHSAETVTRALDYLGLDDPNQDMYSPVADPFAQPFTQQLPSLTQRSMGHARVRSYSSAISSLQTAKTMNTTIVPFSQTGRPRSFTIPSKDVRNFDSYETGNEFMEPLDVRFYIKYVFIH